MALVEGEVLISCEQRDKLKLQLDKTVKDKLILEKSIAEKGNGKRLSVMRLLSLNSFPFRFRFGTNHGGICPRLHPRQAHWIETFCLAIPIFLSYRVRNA